MINKIKKENIMRCFIGFSLPIIIGIIYDIVMKLFDYSDIIGIAFAIIFLYIWYRYGKYIAKCKIPYKFSLYFIHGFLIFGSIISIIFLILYPNAPKFLELITLYTNMYVIVLQSITTPLILLLTYAYEVEVYGLYLNLGCILALIAMMGIFTIGYDKYRED